MKFYITTPIYYINDIPHIGHAYTTLAADIVARYYKQKFGSDNVFFLTGTDEHGAKVASAAKDAGKEPKEFADSIVPKFQSAWKLLNIDYSYFFRTTDPRHEKKVAEILQKIYDKGYIYEGLYEGLYCEGCEKFLTDDDVVGGKCPLHPNKTPVHQKEKNYFFKLSKFKDSLIKDFENDDVEILPVAKKNEILGKLRDELKDIAISREGVTWGIPIPWDKQQTIYVWVEALFNYYTATQFLEDKQRFWPPDVHFIGKDILWFHTVIWCSLLKAAQLPLPKSVFAHGFFTINGAKISKSLGNVIAPYELVDKFGVDATRYLLISEFPFGQDGDFSIDKLTEAYNANLANGLGNVVARVAKLAEQSGLDFDEVDNSNEIYRYEQTKALEEFAFDIALQNIWATDISSIDQHVDQNTPWIIKDKDKLKIVLQEEINEIRKLTPKLKPFMPETAEKIERQFAGPKIKSEPPLFPRI
ncbi:MAG: methionine--tRNA ligase [Candidatus Levybacteria bacterium]|nr:methionine--tRNA ligase [Candidatus Levybacteria bacterium]